MRDQIVNGAFAIGLGGLVCIVLFVPFVALSYRRRGSLSFGRALLWVAVAVYSWAIWTYTLLPLPQSNDYACVGANLDPLDFVNEIKLALASGNPLTSSHTLQLVFNVALFVPLGFFMRVLAGRAVIIATLSGLAVSLMIEFTQITGVWGLYPCAYRVFDVNDLMTNTLGALIGGLLAFAVPAALRGSGKSATADVARPVTRGRRLLAMLCDIAGFTLLTAVVGVGTSIAHALFTGNATAPDWVGPLASLTTLAIWVIVGLATGSTIGDLSVRLRYRGGPVPPAFARPLRLLGGIVGYSLLTMVPEYGGLAALIFAVVSLILALATRQGRGLPGVLSGQELTDAREQHGAPAANRRDPR